MKRQRPATWLLAALLLTAGCAAPVSPATDGDTMPRTTGSAAAAEPFDAFLASVSAATYQDYANRPGTRVRDAQAFQQMRTYILAMYQGSQVARSFAAADGAVFDCVRQPSATTGTAGGAAGCPPGTVPTRRITLPDLVRFPTLHQFLGKSPGGTGQLPLPPSSPKP